jgi:hypothetical protein
MRSPANGPATCPPLLSREQVAKPYEEEISVSNDPKTAESAEFAEKLKLTSFLSAISAYSAVSLEIVC